MAKRVRVPLPTRDEIDRARERLIRGMDQEQRITEVMLRLARAVGPAISHSTALGASYLAGETSLTSADYAFFASPPMLWWKTVLWAHDPAWIYRPANQRVSVRWSLLLSAIGDPSEVVRNAIRSAIHLMLLDGVVLHLIPQDELAPEHASKIEVGLAPKGPLVEAPDLHAPRPELRLSNSTAEVRDRVDLFWSLDESEGAMTLYYTDALLSTRRPSRWPRGLKRLLMLLQRGICPDCAEMIAWNDINVDHVRSLDNGGTSTIINLVLRHSSCNRRKAAHETGWIPSPRVFHGFGVPVGKQPDLLHRLFDPSLTADQLHQFCRQYAKRTGRR